MPGQRLVDGVVDDLVDHVVQAGAVIGVADIHARPLAHRIEALQDLDRLGAVIGRSVLWRAGSAIDGTFESVRKLRRNRRLCLTRKMGAVQAKVIALKYVDLQAIFKEARAKNLRRFFDPIRRSRIRQSSAHAWFEALQGQRRCLSVRGRLLNAGLFRCRSAGDSIVRRPAATYSGSSAGQPSISTRATVLAQTGRSSFGRRCIERGWRAKISMRSSSHVCCRMRDGAPLDPVDRCIRSHCSPVLQWVKRSPGDGS